MVEDAELDGEWEGEEVGMSMVVVVGLELVGLELGGVRGLVVGKI